jgi:fucokinase
MTDLKTIYHISEETSVSVHDDRPQERSFKNLPGPYDICVITAANEHQARGYRRQIRWRVDKGLLPAETEFFVFADPLGKRIGSGGSTIYVLYKLLDHFSEQAGSMFYSEQAGSISYCQASNAERRASTSQFSLRSLLTGKRILILHSGGDSKRLPSYSAVGKIFFPLPTSFSPAKAEKTQDSRFKTQDAEASFRTPYRGSSEGVNGIVCLFDILLHNLMQLPVLEGGQVVLASGDVLLTFDASEVVFDSSGVTGLAYPGPVEVASSHGVYIVPQTLSGEAAIRVVDFLQKPTYEDLRKCDGLDAADRAFIDTGVMNFAIDAIESLMDASGMRLEDQKVVVEKDGLCEHLINASAQLDIYKEIPFAMLGKSERISANAVGPHVEGTSTLHQSIRLLQQIPFSVCLLPYCEFFHIGTSNKLIQSIYTINHTASIYRFQNFNRASISDTSELGSAFIYNSLINTNSAKVNGLALIEGCHLDGEVQLDGENILTGVPKNTGSISLQEGICVTCVPVGLERNNGSSEKENGWVSIIYGLGDSFNRPAGDDSATFLNKAFPNWMEHKGITAADLWEDSASYDLWNARLFAFSREPAESMQISLGLQYVEGTSTLQPLREAEMNRQEVDRWRESCRLSLREILQSVDYERFLNVYSDLYREINLKSLATTMTPESDLSAEEILSWCLKADDYTTAAKEALVLAEESDDILFRARLYKLLSSIIQKAHDSGYSISDDRCSAPEAGTQYEDSAFELVCEAIGKGLRIDSRLKTQDAEASFRTPYSHRPASLSIEIRSDEVVWVCAPTRLDFAGGWSDTPPYCLEHGGSVLNAAVKLNQQYPIQAIGKVHSEPTIKINSIDLGDRVIVTETSEMLRYRDPTHWSSLPKAAFVAAGIMPEDNTMDLKEMLEKSGGGIDLTLFSAVPAGSGLGTSSILGSAIIACLSRMMGQELTPEELFNRTLYMEQLMTTGGGWQDQIGGVVGGVKHIHTDPGLFQIPKISWTDIKSRPDMDMSERFLLYYTGYRRMAKNILHSIVGRYLNRDPVTIGTIQQLCEKSYEMKEQLDHRDIDAFGKNIGEVWKLNKTMDPGTSNQEIESILSRVSHLLHGAKLLGAGGGGFLFMVTKGPEQSQKVKEILEKRTPNHRARFFDFEIDQGGLKVFVL